VNDKICRFAGDGLPDFGAGGAEYARKYLRHRRKMFSTDLVRHLIIQSDKKSAGMGVPA
jgi:hypothetical protein